MVGEKCVWESAEQMKKRVMKVLDKYTKYNTVIVVCHGTLGSSPVIRIIQKHQMIFNPWCFFVAVYTCALATAELLQAEGKPLLRVLVIENQI